MVWTCDRHASVSKKKRLSKDGRACVTNLKLMLITTTVPQLQKMLSAVNASVPSSNKDKDDLMRRVVAALLPEYPYDEADIPEIAEIPETPAVPPGPVPPSAPPSPPGSPPADFANLTLRAARQPELHDVYSCFDALGHLLDAIAADEDARASTLHELCKFDDTIELKLYGLRQRSTLNGEFVDVIGASESVQRLQVRVVSSGEEVRVKPDNTDHKFGAWYLYHTICFVQNLYCGTSTDLYHMVGAIYDLSFTDWKDLPGWVMPPRNQICQSLPWLKECWFDI